jgi:hypothetical protein
MLTENESAGALVLDPDLPIATITTETITPKTITPPPLTITPDLVPVPDIIDINVIFFYLYFYILLLNFKFYYL